MSTESLSQTKIGLRRWINAQIREVTPEQRAEWSQQVVAHLMERDDWVPAPGEGVVTLFGGLKLEVEVMPLFAWLRERGCEVAFFAVESESGVMTARKVNDRDELLAGGMGALEPDPVKCPEVAPEELRVILTPGLAFDRATGMRMGRGKGYYDRVFNTPGCNAARIGVAFDLQVINGVPAEAHDRALGRLVTEKGWLSFPVA